MPALNHNQVLHLKKQRQREEFLVWFDAMGLRAAMQKIDIEPISPDEVFEYSFPGHTSKGGTK